MLLMKWQIQTFFSCYAPEDLIDNGWMYWTSSWHSANLANFMLGFMYELNKINYLCPPPLNYQRKVIQKIVSDPMKLLKT